MNKRFRIFFISLALSLIVLYVLRGAVVRFVINRVFEDISKQYSINIDAYNISSKGLFGVTIDSLTLYEEVSDPFIKISRVELSVRPTSLLLFKPDLKEMNIHSVGINFNKEGSYSNYKILFQREGNERRLQADTLKMERYTGVSLSKLADMYISLSLRALPGIANIDYFNLSYRDSSYMFRVSFDHFSLYNSEYSTSILVEENGNLQKLFCSGVFVKEDKKITSTLKSDAPEGFTIPYLKHKWSTLAGFKTLSFDFNFTARKLGRVELNGNSRFMGIFINNTRLSPGTVKLDSCKFSYKTVIGDNYIEIDSSTKALVNGFTLHPYMKALKNERWRVITSIKSGKFDSQSFFESIPEGIFENLNGIKSSGTAALSFFADIDMAVPDSLKLDVNVESDGFKVLAFAKNDFRRVNDHFKHSVWEDGVYIRDIDISESSKSFIRANRVSPFLITSVLQSEDGGFFYHRGFNPESVREALIVNLKEGRFRRGGSTISMQLVKNLFLNRDKTLLRKAEEAIIVWIIESGRLISKERMFDIYLNIIEWGPGVYGIGEASEFYFNKSPLELNVAESIFLAYIIPSPKRALRNFDSQGVIKEGFKEYFNLLIKRLVVKGVMTDDEANNASWEVILRGRAKELIKDEKRVPYIYLNDTLNTDN